MEGVLPMMALSNREAENATARINDFATFLVRSTPYVLTTPRTIAPSKITRGGPDGIMNVMMKSMRMKAIRMRPKEVPTRKSVVYASRLARPLSVAIAPMNSAPSKNQGASLLNPPNATRGPTTPSVQKSQQPSRPVIACGRISVIQNEMRRVAMATECCAFGANGRWTCHNVIAAITPKSAAPKRAQKSGSTWLLNFGESISVTDIPEPALSPQRG